MQHQYALLAGIAAALAMLPHDQALAQSAKATAAVDSLVALETVVTDDTAGAVVGPWTTILSQEIKTANQKDLFIDVSLECGNYTDTRVKSRDGVEDISSATSGVRVRVLVDGLSALPDSGLALDGGLPDGQTPAGSGVTFCSRLQTLSATLQGILECEADDVIPDDCLVTEEEIALLVSTLSANSFNFVAPDLASGNHVVEVQAMGIVDASAVDGNANAQAFAGAGSVTIEEVRMIRGEQVEF